VLSDCDAVERLFANPLVLESDLFSDEHGIQAVLPFVSWHFPEAKVVAVAIHISSSRDQWESFAETLAPLLTSDTLLVQSTDFSHDLPFQEACRNDQETLRVLAGGDLSQVAILGQPSHIDSRAAQYLQLRLQASAYGSRPSVIASENSQAYAKEAVARTTSYIVQVYSPDPIAADGGRRYFFAGDAFFGRHVTRAVSSGGGERLVARVIELTGGAPLIVNLEGVLLDRCPSETSPYDLCMEVELTLPLLKAMNVVAVGVANNHSLDFGQASLDGMVRRLRSAGIGVLEEGRTEDLGTFRIGALADGSNRGSPRTGRITSTAAGGVGGRPPLFAFVHWGEEFACGGPRPREEAVATALEERGVELIIGSHPHCASDCVCSARACEVLSLGNFIFDQLDPRASGALLEVTFFSQGTYFLRLQRIENLYKSLVDVPGQASSPGREQ